MKNGFDSAPLKWGAALACLNFVVTLFLPMSDKLDMQAVVIISPLTGFTGGVVIYILNFVATEVVKYSKYRLTELKRTKWNNISALLSEQGITAWGKIGAGLALGLLILIVYGISTEEARTLPPFTPLFLVAGFGFGISVYFFQWALGATLSGLSEKVVPPLKQLYTRLKQLYTRWKNHDYRS